MFNWFKKTKPKVKPIVKEKPVVKKEDLDAQIEATKKFVPWQVWADNKHGDQDTMPNVTVVNNQRVSKYVCGCKFEEGLKKYSWNGHWCNLHAKSYSILKREENDE